MAVDTFALTDAAKRNVSCVTAYYEALNSFDGDALTKVLTEDVVTTIPGDCPFTGVYTGIDKFLALVDRIREDSNGTFHVEPLTMMANDNHVFVMHRWQAERQGKTVDMDNFNGYRLNEDARIVERWEFQQNPDVHDDFWS